MTNVLVVLGSARKGRVADRVASYILQEAKTYNNLSLSVVDLAELELPFYNDEYSPSDPNYTATDPQVIAWGKRVSEADAVLFVTPEYNHTLSAIQKNAIDWLYAEWKDKPLGIVAYGFYEGKYVLESIQNVIGVVSPDVRNKVGLGLMKHLNPDGSAIEEDEVVSRINATVAAVLS